MLFFKASGKKEGEMASPASAFEAKSPEKPSESSEPTPTKNSQVNWLSLLARFAPIVAALIIALIIPTIQPKLSTGLTLIGFQAILFVLLVKAWAPKLF